GLGHRQHPEAAQRRVQRPDRVDLRHDHLGAEAAAYSATPRPLAPNPATTTVLPASRVLVARRMPSTADWPVPQVLSTMRLTAVSLAAITGKASAPSAAIRRSLITPVAVDSRARSPSR